MSLARAVLQVMFENDDDYTVAVYEQILEENLLPLIRLFNIELKNDWEENSKRLLPLVEGTGMPMLHYLVWCSRILELTSLCFFLSQDQAEKDKLITFLVEFIEKEEGCGHIPSDRYAVSLIWTTLALLQAGKRDKAKALIKRGVIWLCDRTEKGFGLAHYDADEYEETTILVGYPFDFIKVHRNHSSYLATVLSDLAAFIGDKDFYSVVVNDIEACEITYTYWQFPDTIAIFTIETEECITYPNIPHQFSINDFEDFEYAEHMKHEPQSFKITQKAGLNSLILLSTLLKDRYFPKMWKHIVDLRP